VAEIDARVTASSSDPLPIGTRERRQIHIEGIVQGVGFRPFIFQLAQRYALGGWVLNNSTGVVIQAEGDANALDAFTRAIETDAPPLARIMQIGSERVTPLGEDTFRIAASNGSVEKRAWIAPDSCICDDCLRELFNPNDRRYRYPFINCTNCGPRFTIIKDVPYDRPLTTMVEFRMCARCQSEYDDPLNRRFHAQPNACARCGPVAILQYEQRIESDQDAIQVAIRLLDNENILAVKGLGGFHLVCDATSDYAVSQLRTRKKRYDKPFALMVHDVETARELCKVNELEEKLLTSRRRPIVLLRQREPQRVADQIAPNQKYLGVMLPYTPLHYLLLDTFTRAKRGKLAVLVMTSGNVSDEPIAYKGKDARERLGKIADHFLNHDREIFMRCDDSVTRVVDGQELLLRRSRGHVPEPIRAPQPFRQPLLATGAHLKNTFCLAKDQYAFVSHHIGDLENFETLKSFTEGIEHFKRLFDIEPRVVAYDLHPEYLSTKHALELNLPAIGVQHHHAHVAAVMGEHGITERVIGVAFDGTGYGTDGTIWGGEFLAADLAEFERAAHLDPLPLIGGEQAIHQVWRLAAAWLDKVYGDAFLDLEIDFVRQLDRAKWRVLKQMADMEINSPRSSAMGRLFDAVSALIGVRQESNYEAQAAIELEMHADESCVEKYTFEIFDARPRVLKMDAALRGIVGDLQNGVDRRIIARKFHNTIAAATASVCDLMRIESGLSRVVLSGGVFQNTLLLQRTLAELRGLNFNVLVPTQLPPNDGAISFGQALIANAKVKGEG